MDSGSIPDESIMTTIIHIWQEKLNYPKSIKDGPGYHRMLCGEKGSVENGLKYVTKEMVIRELKTNNFAEPVKGPRSYAGGISADAPYGTLERERCTRCFNHPEIQLLTLKYTDIGD